MYLTNNGKLGASGTRLYVDGSLVASTKLTGAQAGSGYWRLGGGNLAYYGSVLSAGTIAAQFKAAA